MKPKVASAQSETARPSGARRVWMLPASDRAGDRPGVVEVEISDGAPTAKVPFGPFNRGDPDRYPLLVDIDVV